MVDSENPLPYDDDDDDVPQDDEGVKSQKVLDICGYAIDLAWEFVFSRDLEDKPSIDELSQVMKLAGQAHILATDVILNSSKIDALSDGSEDAEGYNPYDEDEDDGYPPSQDNW